MTSAKLQVRKTVLDYKRDTYLGSSPVISKNFVPLDCAVGYSQWGVSSAAIQAHKQFDPKIVHCYPEMFYDKLLKPAIIERFHGAAVAPSQLFFGHGSFNLAERLIHKLIAPTRMLGVGPQFNEIPSEFIAAGGVYHPIEIDLNNCLFPTDEVLSVLKQADFSVLYLDNPNNPLGRLVNLDDIKKLIGAAEKVGTIVLMDEAYGDFVPDECSAVALINSFDNLAVIRSFSKCLGLAAERVGYMFLSKKLAEYYKELDVPFEPGLYGAVMSAATLKDVSFLERIRKEAKTVKEYIMSALEQRGFSILPTHEATSILTVHKNEKDVVAEFSAMGVLVEPGEASMSTHKHFDNSYCRIRIPECSAEFVRRLKL